jgi:endonuclease III
MLPLFAHEDTDRAREMVARIKPLADAYWAENDPADFATNPFSVMVVALFSPRTQTEASRTAMQEVFALNGDTPQAVSQLEVGIVEAILAKHDVRFPDAKAKHLIEAAKQLVENGGIVPDDLTQLMQYPGMGWKTSLLTLWLAYNKAPEICVDVHVARIGQRNGLVNPKTNDPRKISRELMSIVPKEYWGEWNSCFVYFGKTRCYPIHPACNGCPIYDLCERVGVKNR